MDTTLTLTNQTNLFINGLEKVISASPTEIIIEIDGKRLVIFGENMEVKTLDLDNKVFIIEGLINSLKYTKPKQSFIKRIFK